MTEMTRRHLLRSAAVLGAGFLTACTSSPRPRENTAASAPTTSAGAQTGGSHPAPQGELYGVGIYNTPQVADELRYIAENIRPRTDGRPQRILITGSTAGVGQLAAAHLLRRGHTVVAHARNSQREVDVRRDLPGLEAVVGDLLDLAQTRALAEQINALGAFDVIIHNAGEYGLPDEEILNANSLSPYLLTALVDAPREQMMYLSSDLHLSGDLKLDDLRSGATNVNYNDSKLHMAMLVTGVARRRPDLRVNWRPARLRGAGGFVAFGAEPPRPAQPVRAERAPVALVPDGHVEAADATVRIALTHIGPKRRGGHANTERNHEP